MDCSLPGSSVYGILQAKVPEWGVIAFSDISSRTLFSLETISILITGTTIYLSLAMSYNCFQGGSVVKNPPANEGDTGAITGSGRSPGGGNSNPLQYLCLNNPMDRGAWWATVHSIAEESDMTERLNSVLTFVLIKIATTVLWLPGPS